MTAQELLDAAVAMVCEDPTNTDAISDYTERAPYLLATFLNQCTPLDRQYRKAHGLGAVSEFECAAFGLEEIFPLSKIFATAAVYYLAAMLVLDENEVMSDKLFARYSDLLASIQETLPAAIEPIKDKHKLI
ncbi:MAG: hypothetical protein IJW30_05995 [Clostridia bacterium]|nr:hypothetical protein [Clostridia bacterium]MBQ9774199.1 hypothetical protein [Clostridia bacterium]